MEKKRTRKPGWTEEQGLLLAQLVNEHKGMLRGKFGPTVTSQGKRRAWDTISQTINASFPLVVRTGDDCEKRWYVLQSKAKDEIAAHKRESSLTRLSQVADTVFQVLGHSEVSVTGLPTGIDTSMMQALEVQQRLARRIKHHSHPQHLLCQHPCRRADCNSQLMCLNNKKKVLSLQEEYYRLKIEHLKNKPCTDCVLCLAFNNCR
ncbi:zinc finger protein [Sarotherodon galilaeus]